MHFEMRPVSPGDEAIVNGIPYTITTIASEGIYLELPQNQQALLTLVGNQWQVYNYQTPHQVEFRAAHVTTAGLTNIPDMDKEILLWLDFYSIMSMCQTSSYLHSLCQDEHFWKRKIQLDFGAEKLQDTETYQQFYRRVFAYWQLGGDLSYEIIHKATINGRTDILKLALIASQNTVFPNQITLDLAVTNGHLNVLKLVAPYVLPSPNGVRGASLHGHLDILQWLYDHTGGELFPTSLAAVDAAAGGHLHILQWLYDVTGDISLFTQRNMYIAVANGYMDMVQWLYQISGGLLQPEQKAVNVAASEGNLDFLKWLHQISAGSIRPDQEGVTQALLNEHYGIYNWTISLLPPVYPDSDKVINQTIEDDYCPLETLEWLSSLQPPILPSQTAVTAAVEHNELEVLTWLAPRFLPTQDDVALTVEMGNWDIVQEIFRLNPSVQLTSSDANQVFDSEDPNVDILEWMSNLNPPVLPNDKSVYDELEEEEVVEWLKQKGLR